MKKIIIALISVALLMNMFTGLAFGASQNAPLITVVDQGFKQVSESANLILYSNVDIGAVAVKNKTTGFIWYSAVPTSVYNREGLSDYLCNALDSMFTLTYTELNLNNDKVTTETINNMKPVIAAETVENGVILKYTISSINIEIDVSVKIDDTSLVVSIPSSGVIEGKGTKEKMDINIEKIKTFITTANANIKEIEKLGIDQTSNTINDAKNQINKLKDLITGLDSVIGIAAVTDQASVIIQDNLNIDFFGGTDNEKGLYYKILNSSKVSDSDKENFRSQSSDLSDISDTAMYSFGLLKTIKYGGIINIELMNNFGASGDNESGYVFYPDGSGAISYNKADHGVISEYYDAAVYSDEKFDMAWENSKDNVGIKRCMLPVFGSKRGNDAYLATIEQGDANADICYYPSGNTYNLNRVFPKFIYRNKVDITSNSQYSASGVKSIFEKKMIKNDVRVRYIFLENNDASYSGMANCYRNYLLSKSMINKSTSLAKGVPLALDIIAGTSKSMLFFNTYVPLTTFDQLQFILNDLKKAGVSNTLVNVSNWTKDLKSPTNPVPSPNSGGEKGLKSLVLETKKLGGSLFLEGDFADADSNDRFIDNSQLALDTNLRTFGFSTQVDKLFSTFFVKKNIFNAADNKYKLFGNAGMTLKRIPTAVYYDYNSKYLSSRAKTVQTWKDIYTGLSSKLDVASEGGNLYTLKDSDWLLDIPMGSTGYIFSDRSVPFYQMVIHGLIPYTAKPFNEFYDKQIEKLKTIEYGCSPLFKLTYSEYDIKSGNGEVVFATPYNKVRNNIVSISKEFNNNLSQFSNQTIINHEYISDEVVVVTYSNNKKIYINYSNKPQKINEIEIKPKDYTIA
jgi:hypothetical protein